MEVPADTVIVFSTALATIDLRRRDDVYFAGRATLVRRPEDLARYDRVFSRIFGPAGETQVATEVRPGESSLEAVTGAPPPAGPSESSVAYSAVETLRHEDFARYSDEEWEEARRFIARLRSHAELRRTRRRRPARRGSEIDLAQTVRQALATDGEPIRPAFRRPAARPRRLVFLIDVSGSMEPYARAFLRFAHSAMVARPVGKVEVFLLGTRISRVTSELSSRDPDAAMASVARLVEDWFGGTRLGDGLRTFNRRWGASGVARGAVVIILSDGLDRGDPGALAHEMERLGRLASRVVWVNPLRASSGYEPIARGMAAALPFVDSFIDGHSLASLEQLALLVGGDDETESARGRQYA